jgi:hypothetical protein
MREPHVANDSRVLRSIRWNIIYMDILFQITLFIISYLCDEYRSSVKKNCYDLIGHTDSQTEQNVKNVFRDAAEYVPCILCLKHVHAFQPNIAATAQGQTGNTHTHTHTHSRIQPRTHSLSQHIHSFTLLSNCLIRFIFID